MGSEEANPGVHPGVNPAGGVTDELGEITNVPTVAHSATSDASSASTPSSLTSSGSSVISPSSSVTPPAGLTPGCTPGLASSEPMDMDKVTAAAIAMTHLTKQLI